MENETKEKIKGKPTFIIILTVLAVIAIGVAGFFYYKYQKADKMLTDPAAVNAEEAKKMADKISKFYTLPSDETPNIATVLDIEKLKDQPFFKDAKNGDKVLIYQKAAVAILYRPDTNKIITVSPVSGVGTPVPATEAPQTAATLAPTAKPAAEPSGTPPTTP